MSAIHRRQFAQRLGASALAIGLPGWALAQGGPVEGRDFARLDKPASTASPGKVEVVEFFGYWCPHCNAFEPALDAWARRQGANGVVLRRLPVAFRPTEEPLQRLYYALETMGQVDTLHRKVFEAIHTTRKLPPAAKDSEIAEFVKSQGLDATKVQELMTSFSVTTKARQVRALAEAYAIDSVPTLGVQGRWRTSPSMAGSNERALAVVDALAAQVKKGG